MYSHIEKLSDSENLCQVLLNVHAIISSHTEEYLPLHTALQWDSTGCKATEPSNAHRITFICKPLSVDPLTVSHWEGLEKVQQSLWLLSTEGLWIPTLPTPNVFLGQQCVSLSSCPWANTSAFGTRRQRRENMDTYFKVSSGFKGQEAEENDFCPFLSSPEHQMWGVEVVEGDRTVVTLHPASLFRTTHPAFGEVQRFQHSRWDFPGVTIYQLVIQPALQVLFWKNHGIFKEVRGHCWLGLTFTLIFIKR